LSSKKISASNKLNLVKIGGNALTDPETKQQIIFQVAELHTKGYKLIIVHGGGIEIQQLLDDVEVESKFAGGHRLTDARSMTYVEMALSGMVNKELVGLLNHAGIKAVGISGKDAGMVKARKRTHIEKGVEIDLGFVGDVSEVDTSLVHTLTEAGYLPIISPVSIGNDGHSYNINADMFAGHLAGELKADKFIALTNIDGLLKHIDDPGSIITSLTPTEARSLFGTVIQGGMIPKIESCLIALEKGVNSAQIINGTKEGNLLRIFSESEYLGTTIT
jgi:acetylglutamate kinase